MLNQNIKTKRTKIKVLVTGATGFTGNALAKTLCANGYDVRVFVRDKEKFFALENNGNYDVIVGDLRDPEIVAEAVKGVEKVFHIAAIFRSAGITDQVYRDVHVKGTKYLLESSLKYGIQKFVHCSTGGVHGHIEDPPANESYRFKPGDIYQVTKLDGEFAALDFHKKTGLPVSVVRPTPIYGPGDLRLLKVFKLALHTPTIVLGSGEIYYHLVYIDDLVNGFILASEVEEAVGESFIIGGDDIPTLNQILDKIAEIFNSSKFKIHLPAFPVQIAGTLCEKICIPLGIEPPIYRRRVDFFTKSRSFDISKAKKILNYQPKVSVDEGLARTAEWYKNQNLI